MRFAIVPLFWAGSVLAQTPESALSSQWTAICAGAIAGSGLQQRCAEIFAGGPGSRDTAAIGNFLDELPAQGRTSTRAEAAPTDAARQSLGAHWSLFASATAGRLDRRDSANEAAFAGDTGALLVGIDWAPTDAWLVGATLSHSRESLDFDASQGSARSRYTGLLGYATWSPRGALALQAYAGTLDGSNELRRAIDYTLPSAVRVHSVAEAAPGAQRRLAGLGLDWIGARAAWQWQAGIGADVMRTRLSAFSENGGAGLALAVPTRQIETRRGRLDASLAHTLSQSWGVWQPQLRLGWRHEFANPSRLLSVRFLDDANGTLVRFETEDPDSNWAELALGSVFTLTGGHSGFVEWRQRIGHDFLQDRELALGWRHELR